MRRVFYDRKCAFCCTCVQKIKKIDKKKQFIFSAIDGKKAQQVLGERYAFLRRKKSVVFIEGSKVWIKANAIFRIFWLIGGKYKVFGWMYALPGFIINPFYRLVTYFRR